MNVAAAPLGELEKADSNRAAAVGDLAMVVDDLKAQIAARDGAIADLRELIADFLDQEGFVRRGADVGAGVRLVSSVENNLF